MGFCMTIDTGAREHEWLGAQPAGPEAQSHPKIPYAICVSGIAFFHILYDTTLVGHYSRQPALAKRTTIVSHISFSASQLLTGSLPASQPLSLVASECLFGTFSFSRMNEWCGGFHVTDL